MEDSKNLDNSGIISKIYWSVIVDHYFTQNIAIPQQIRRSY